MTRPLSFFVIVFFFIGISVLHAREIIPPKPVRYFNDAAGATSSTTQEFLNQQLEDFERKTSNQIVVAIYPRMQSDSSIEDYTVRVAQTWGVGQKDRKNGIVFFVFIQDHKMYIQVGYGLEGALPDALAKQIIEEEIKPHFKREDYEGGFKRGVEVLIAATRGEYKGSGKTVYESRKKEDASGLGNFSLPIIIAFYFLIFIYRFSRATRRTIFSSRGVHTSSWLSGWNLSSWGGGSSGSGSFGGGGFSGGGGSFGGGGAGGSW